VAVTSSIDCVLRLWDLEAGVQAGEIKAGPGEVRFFSCGDAVGGWHGRVD
jgi:hypothetical protein